MDGILKSPISVPRDYYQGISHRCTSHSLQLLGQDSSYIFLGQCRDKRCSLRSGIRSFCIDSQGRKVQT